MATSLSARAVLGTRTFLAWLPAVRQRLRRHWLALTHRLEQARHAQAEQRAARRDRSAREACAAEGADLEFGNVELDGHRFGALYRGGELVCLLPEVDRL